MIQVPYSRPIAYHPAFAVAFGGIEEAIFLQQLLYWSDKGGREDGFIYKTKKDWEDETYLTRRQQDRIVTKFKEIGIIETAVIKIKGATILHYKVNEEKVQNVLLGKYKMHFPESTKSAFQESTKGAFPPITESTTESTYKGTANADASEVNPLIELFKEIDPAYTRYFRNKTERRACEDLLKAFTFEQIQERVKYVPMYNKMPFVNTYSKVYKPSDLLRNWQVMEDNVASARQAKKGRVREMIN